MERLALDRHYFAKPAQTLFGDIRHFFPISAQLRVYCTCVRAMGLATEYVDIRLREGVTFDGSHYTLENAPGRPRPLQSPHPPSIVAGSRPTFAHASITRWRASGNS